MSKQRALIFITAALASLPAGAEASGTPSIAKAETFTQGKLERKYRDVLSDYPDAVVTVECKLKKTLKSERRYKCTWSIPLGFDGGFDGADSPSGFAWTYWYKTKPWTTVIFPD